MLTCAWDHVEGSRYGLNEVRELLHKDDKMHPNNLSEEKKEYYIQELIKHRDLSTHGVHINDITVAKDVLWVTHEITKEVCVLIYLLPLLLTVL